MSEPDAYASTLPRLEPAIPRTEMGRATRYGAVGVTNVTIDFVLYALLVTIGVWYPIAKGLSLSIATLNGYTFNRRWTFRAGPHQHTMLAKYVAVQAGCYLANLAVLAVLVEVLERDEIVAQLIALPPIAAMSFLAQRHWTFGRHVS